MTIRQRVLIVEEDREIYSSISMLLSDNGYEVLYAYTGEEALSLIGSHCPDIILLDLVLPDMAGMEVLDSVREWSLVPMIVLARKKEEQDIVLALDHGADDYVALPYGEQELLARMRAAIRHTRTGSADLELANKGRITVGRMIIDYDKYRVYMDGEDVNLT